MRCTCCGLAPACCGRRDEAALSLPVAAAANNLYIKARSEDLGDLDFSAVLKVVQDSQQQK